MNNELLVLNPSRRRHRRRHMTALQRQYFGPKRHRRAVANPHRRRKHHRKVTVARKRYLMIGPLKRRARRNPPAFGGVTAQVTELFKDGIAATAGITLNQAAGNLIGEKLLKVNGMKRQGVKIGTAVVLPLLAGMLVPKARRLAVSMGAAALAMEAVKILERDVYPGLGPIGQTLSVRDTPAQPAGGKFPAAVVGYLPGAGLPAGALSYRSDTPGLPAVPLSSGGGYIYDSSVDMSPY